MSFIWDDCVFMVASLLQQNRLQQCRPKIELIKWLRLSRLPIHLSNAVRRERALFHMALVVDAECDIHILTDMMQS